MNIAVYKKAPSEENLACLREIDTASTDPFNFGRLCLLMTAFIAINSGICTSFA